MPLFFAYDINRFCHDMAQIMFTLLTSENCPVLMHVYPACLPSKLWIYTLNKQEQILMLLILMLFDLVSDVNKSYTCPQSIECF